MDRSRQMRLATAIFGSLPHRRALRQGSKNEEPPRRWISTSEAGTGNIRSLLGPRADSALHRKGFAVGWRKVVLFTLEGACHTWHGQPRWVNRYSGSGASVSLKTQQPAHPHHRKYLTTPTLVNRTVQVSSKTQVVFPPPQDESGPDSALGRLDQAPRQPRSRPQGLEDRLEIATLAGFTRRNGGFGRPQAPDPSKITGN